MKINILKILCGSDQPLPTHSFVQLLFMACVFVFSSYANADVVTGSMEKMGDATSLGSVILLGFGMCSLLIVRRRKPWIAAVNETNLRHG